MFFNTHQCTKHCRALGLVNPKDTQELPEDFKLLRDLDSEIDLMKNVNKLCDLCRKPFVTNQGRYIEKRSEGHELWCSHCTIKRNKSLTSSNCDTCKKDFNYAAYWFKMKKSDPPTSCWACRLNQRNEERKKLGYKPANPST